MPPLIGKAVIVNTSVSEYTPPFKVYKALISENEPGAPEVFVIENTLGADIVWTSNSSYITGTLTNGFPFNKTICYSGDQVWNNLNWLTPGVVRFQHATPSTVNLVSYGFNGDTFMNFLQLVPITIEVYP